MWAITRKRSRPDSWLQSRFRPSRRAVSTSQAGITVVLDLDRGGYYTLNDVASRTWTLLLTGSSVEAIVAQLQTEYDIAPAKLEADILALIERLHRIHLIEQQPTDIGAYNAELYVPGRVSIVELIFCTALIGIVKIGVRAFGLRRSLRLINDVTEKRIATGMGRQDQIDTLAQAVTTAGAFFPGRAQCLEQSLVLYTRLRIARLPASLRLGVQTHPFEAHAWIEYNRIPLHEDPERLKRFHPFPEASV